MSIPFKIVYVSKVATDFWIDKAVEAAFAKAITLIENRVLQFFTTGSLAWSVINENGFDNLVKEADLIIFHISNSNVNSFYELGLATGLEKPIIILIDNNTPFLTDIASVRYITFDPKTPTDYLTNHLAKSITLAIADPNDWKLPFKGQKKAGNKNDNTVFISYSHKDTLYLERLKVHLKPLVKKGLVKVWSDTQIQSGEKWKEKIQEALNKAAIAVLLISADFLASDFITDHELQPLLEAAKNNGTIILPIILKPCRYLREPSISQFQAVNDPINPICRLSEYEQEEVYDIAAQRIELAVGSE